MNNDKLLTNYQLLMLIMGFLYGSSTIVTPGKAAGRDGWIALIIAIITGVVLIYGYTFIAKLNPKKNLVEILQKHFGKFLGSIIAVFYIWYFIHLGSLVFRNFGEFIIISTFTETPMLFVIVCMAGVVAYATRKGVNIAGRANEILVPILFFAITFINLSVIKNYEFKNLLPIMEDGLKPVLSGSFAALTFPFGEIVVFLMIFPYLKKQNAISKISILGVIIAGIFLLSIAVRNTAVLGEDLKDRSTFAMHTLATLTENYSYEPVIDLAVLTGGGAKLGIIMFAACSAIAQLFNIRNYKPFALPVITLTVSLSIWVYKDTVDMFDWAVKVWPYYSIPFQMVIPGILLVLSLVRNKRDCKT